MAQQIFWEYKADDSTISLIRWLLGILPSGRYTGFDFVPGGDMNLTLDHDTTGYDQVRSNLTAVKTGVLISQQGAIVQEDTNIVLPVNTTGANPRIDIIVMTHQYEASMGGLPAAYSIVQGTPDPSPVAPSVNDPLTDVIVGTLSLPANCVALNQAGVEYTPNPVPRVGLDEIDWSKVVNKDHDHDDLYYRESEIDAFFEGEDSGKKQVDWARLTNVPSLYTQSQIDAFFEGEDSGKKQVDWARITNKPSASESTAGVIEIATQTETNTGSDDARALTPAKIRNATNLITGQAIDNDTIVRDNIDFSDFVALEIIAIRVELYTAVSGTITNNVTFTDNNNVLGGSASFKVQAIYGEIGNNAPTANDLQAGVPIIWGKTNVGGNCSFNVTVTLPAVSSTFLKLDMLIYG